MSRRFIVIGAMKSGTTSLHRYLQQHPDISMPKRKETDFFLAEPNFRLGTSWYQRQFDPRAKVCGEVAPNYTKFPEFPGVPERIVRTFPDVRLIYLVRDPVERFLSQYRHHYLLGETNQQPDTILDSKPGRFYLDCSSYHSQLTRYLDYFPFSQILVVATEELARNRDAVLERLIEFIGAGPLQSAGGPDERMNRAEDLPHLPSWAATARRTPTVRAIRQHVPEPFRDWLVRRLASTGRRKPPILDSRLRSKVTGLLRADTAAFRRLTGQCFAEWSV